MTILNCDYKLISSAIAARISPNLNEIIHDDQCGFCPKRYIGESLRTTHDTLEWANRKKITGILLILDFEKAFDSLSFRSIVCSMSFFNFKPNIIKWVKTLLSHFKARINNAGNLSDFFNVERGARQGDPISSILFILTIEIMAIKIRNSKSIKGITIGCSEIKIALYADDSNIFLLYDAENLRNTVKILNDFYLFSGLKIQTEKSQCVVFGEIPGGDFSLCHDLNLVWKQDFISLGIKFTPDLNSLHENFELKLLDIDKTVDNWKYRFLSPYGSICVAKTLLLSKLSHLAIILPNLSPAKLKIIEDKIFKFIWKGNKDKVARIDAKNPEKKGGLNCPDIYSSWSSFKVSWWRRLFQKPESNWAKIFQENLKDINPLLNTSDIFLKLGLIEIDKLGKKFKNNFWSQCFSNLKPLILEACKNSPEYILNSPIWGSCFFLRNNQLCKRETFYPLSESITFPSDLLESTPVGMKFINYKDVNIRSGSRIDNEKYIELRYIITEGLRKYNIFLSSLNICFPCKPTLVSILMMYEKGCNFWSKILKKKKLRVNTFHQKERNWECFLNLNTSHVPTPWFLYYHFNTRINFDNKIKWLNYQIVRGTLKTNRIICKFIPEISEKCSFCNNDVETISHLFWDCPISSAFINSVFLSLRNWPGFDRDFTSNSFIFGNLNEFPSSPMNFLSLYLKHYIWVSRCKKTSPELTGFLNKFKFEVRIFKNCIDNFPQLSYLNQFDISDLLNSN